MFFLFHIIWLNLNFVLDVLAYTFHYSIIKVLVLRCFHQRGVPLTCCGQGHSAPVKRFGFLDKATRPSAGSAKNAPCGQRFFDSHLAILGTKQSTLLVDGSVELRGLEPLTFALQRRCSPN